MKTYVFEDKRWVVTCSIVVSAESEGEALMQATGICSEFAELELASVHKGTLEDYLGADAMERIATKHKSLKPVYKKHLVLPRRQARTNKT